MIAFAAALPFAATPAVGGGSLTGGQWGMVCAAILTILYAVLRKGRKKPDPMARPPAQASLAQERSVERQMQQLLVELSKMAQQITAQLDTRSAKLALMIDDADDKAARLQRVLDDCRATLAAAAAAPPPPPVLATSPEPAEVPALRPVFEPSIELVASPDAGHRQVYALADQGRSAADIARELDRPHGEVELILALRPRKS